MSPATYTVVLDGRTLQRGFWLYVWEVTTPNGAKLLYVGRTGDSSSINAQSPFNRMGDVMNTVHCRKPLDEGLYVEVRAAFAAEFPRL
jgi:hypothetical protein